MYDLDCLVAAPRVVLLLSFGSSTGLGLDTVIGSFEFFLCCDFLFFLLCIHFMSELLPFFHFRSLLSVLFNALQIYSKALKRCDLCTKP